MSAIEPWNLRWRDVDPSIVAFDRRPAREITQAAQDAGGRAQFDETDRALIAAYGLWAVGWRWSISEGGPMTADCWPDINAALGNWREWLELLAQAFSALDAKTANLPIAWRIELAATRLLAMVTERTDCDESWYRTFITTIAWYVERLVPEHELGRAVEQALAGRFRSWVAPDEDTAKAMFGQLGAELEQIVAAPLATEDATRAWELTRRRVEWSYASEPSHATATTDGHLAYIEARDRPRDDQRATRLLEALSQVRASARRGEPLTMALLSRWQKRVLGLAAEPGFRTSDAYAKGGRERYGFGPRVEQDFERCLAQANDASLGAAARAARVYLDICFFHPFDDGNARAARLALDHVLTSAGLALLVADPVFAFSRWADDDLEAYGLRFTLERMVGQAG
jgi:hypothetical protein